MAPSLPPGSVELRADCGRCAALCCIGLSFDASPQFALSKPAGTRCPHLSRTERCTIHAARVERGFAGCVAYDCLGAGQRVTQELFQGRSPSSEPELLAPMLHAFARLRALHELLQLLETARRLPLDAVAQQRAQALYRQVDDACVAPPVEEAGELARLTRLVGDFLRTLRGLPYLATRPVSQSGSSGAGPEPFVALAALTSQASLPRRTGRSI